MTWFSFLILFGTGCVFIPCQGAVFPPNNGSDLVFLPGSTARINWTFDEGLAVRFRDWSFTSTDGSFKELALASIGRSGSIVIETTLLEVAVEKPATLVLKNVNNSYDGKYKFQLLSTSNLDSEVVVVIVVTPNITFSCSNPSTVNEDNNFTCLCKAERGRPTADVTWYDKNDVKINETGKGEQLLRLTYVNAAHSGTYTCKAQSHINATDEKSIEVKVRLNYKPQDTNITFTPKEAAVGGSVNITCESDGLPEPSYAIFHNGSQIDNRRTHLINNVSYTHNGTYKCVATNKLGNDSASANLTVVEPPPLPSSSQQIDQSTQLLRPSTTQPIQVSTIRPSTTQPSIVQTTVPSTTPKETSPDGGSDEISTGVIVGAACGGAALIVIVAGVVIYIVHRGRDKKSDVNPNGSKVITNHYELEEDQLEGGGSAYDTVKPPDKGEGSQNNAEQKPPGDSLPPVYASVDRENRQGNTLYASLDSEALKRPSQKKPAENQPKIAPTEYASIDFMKTAKTPNDDSVST